MLELTCKYPKDRPALKDLMNQNPEKTVKNYLDADLIAIEEKMAKASKSISCPLCKIELVFVNHKFHHDCFVAKFKCPKCNTSRETIEYK